MQLQSSHCRLVSFLPVYLINMLLFSTLVAVSGVPKIRPMFGDLLGLTALIAKIYDSGLVRMHRWIVEDRGGVWRNHCTGFSVLSPP